MTDPAEPDDEPTTIRPSPLPASLVEREATISRSSSRGFSASLRGRVGKYELRDKLGRGAFGVVFTARDPSLDRDVAIKVLRPTHLTNQEIVQRFLQEARATARIAHPGIVTIHDCGQVDTGAGVTAFIAMELLSGESLTSRLLRCVRLAPQDAIEIARQVASALEAAHRADVLHRDLKPDNIYVVPDPAMPSGERVKVLDFGLAKLGHEGHTQLQTVFGTPRYMSPEQCRSATQVDHRSDIYSLGCILFELVTGRLPFDGDVRQLIERHQRATPPRASSLAPELSPALDDLIDEMLAKDPMVRPQTMGAVQRALIHAASAYAPLPEAGYPWLADAVAIGTDPAWPPRPTDGLSPLALSRTPEVCRLALPLQADPSRILELLGPPELTRPDLPGPHGRSGRPELPMSPEALRADEAAIAAARALEINDTTRAPTICDPGLVSGEILVAAIAPGAPIGHPPRRRSSRPRSAAARRHRRAMAVWAGALALLTAAVTALVRLLWARHSS